MIKTLIKHLYKKGFYHRPPNELTSKWDWSKRGATHDQQIIMRFGLARTPHDAQLLMDKKGAKSAWDIVDKMPPRKRRNARAKLIALIRRLDGHDPRDPYKDKGHDNEIKRTYRFK
jgi:hypothetical protein